MFPVSRVISLVNVDRPQIPLNMQHGFHTVNLPGMREEYTVYFILSTTVYVESGRAT